MHGYSKNGRRLRISLTKYWDTTYGKSTPLLPVRSSLLPCSEPISFPQSSRKRVDALFKKAAKKQKLIGGKPFRRQNPTSKYYDYRLIYERLQAIIEVREDDDILGLVNLLRSGLVRNLGNISAPRLFNRAYAGTKLLIEDYITQVALAIEYVTTYPTTPGHESGLTNQAKLDVLHDTRQAFGRSALVLQGGAIFGLCHLGVVKALHLRGLLPRIIAGTATGALIAALVGVHTEDEILEFLTGDGIDVTAFARNKDHEKQDVWDVYLQEGSWWGATLLRRLIRLAREGYLLDAHALEECVRANVGDLTFEEAYAKTKRVLNITVSTTSAGVPNLLNYLTAPNVVSPPPFQSSPPTSRCNMAKHPLPTPAHLVRRHRLQRLLLHRGPPRRAPLQGRKRPHRPLGLRPGSDLPPVDPRQPPLPAPLVQQPPRPRVAPQPHRRALQRQPLHRLPGPPLPRAVPAERPPPPESAPGRQVALQHADTAARRARGAAPAEPAGQRGAAAGGDQAVPARRERAGCELDARAGADGAGFLAVVGVPDAGELGVLDLARRAQRVAGGGRAEGAVRD